MIAAFSRRLWVALAVATALAGCSSGDGQVGAEPKPTVSQSVSADAPASSPTVSRTTSPSRTPTATPSNGPGPRGVEITLPPSGVEATGPAVVLVHGGFWVAGTPSDMDAWAEFLAASGAVVFNASYRLVGPQGGGYPASLDDIACAVRYARAEAPALTTSDQLVVMGHSAGGHLAAVVALNGDEFGADCPYPEAPLPDRLVGMAGVYDVRTLGPLFAPFVGAPQSEEPERWTSVNPIELASRRDDLSVLLVVAARDEIIPRAGSADFSAALAADDVTTEVIPGIGHAQLLDPDLVGLTSRQLLG